MAWTGHDQPDDNGFVGNLNPDRVLYFYDGPILFTTRIGVFYLLVYKVDETDDVNLFIVKQVLSREIELLEAGKLSLRGALQASSYWLVQTTKDLTASLTWSVAPDDMPAKYLPRAGFGLKAGQRRLPDTLLQSESFFSVRFTGASLGRGRVSLRVFKELTDRFFDASTRLLKPEAIQGLKSRKAFDLTMSEPQFASLLVALNEPEIDVDFVNSRNESRGVSDIFDYRQEVFDRREGFFNAFGEVVEEVDRGSIKTASVAQHYSLLQTMQSLLPNGEDSLRTTEFYANGELAGRKVFLDVKAGVTLRNAIDSAQYVSRGMTGRVIIVNESSGTFVVKDLISHRKTTCNYKKSWFDYHVGTGQLRAGSILTVHGKVVVRSNRDRMDIEREPVFQKMESAAALF